MPSKTITPDRVAPDRTWPHRPPSDRYTKVVLTLIAAGLWALTMTQLELPEAQAGPWPALDAGDGSTVAQERLAQERREDRDPATAGGHDPISTKPVRWRIPYARHRNRAGAGTLDCMTAVSVVSFAPNLVQFDVEFLDHVGNTEGLTTRSLSSMDPEVVISDSDTAAAPINYDASAGTGGFDGYALVSATDPRIFVTALLRCGEDGSEIASSITAIPAFPVGSTAQYFQAAVPTPADMPHIAKIGESEIWN